MTLSLVRLFPDGLHRSLVLLPCRVQPLPLFQVRIRVPKDRKLGKLLQDVQVQSTRAIPFEQAGMYQIRQLTAGTRSACSFQTAFIVQAASCSSGIGSSQMPARERDVRLVSALHPDH
ncbi:uncharacterized protein BDV17DRAFT_254827 [Aspergillus undulatus]|uniref:uncharacterized protein n=1 Tax=Aspergillus undulatus TaxID=1810928 RepID=UPI003CCDABD2